MNYDYLGRSHNKIFKKNKIIYKFFRSEHKYKSERDFYLLAYRLDYIPKIYYYSDKRKMIIIENVGKSLTPTEFKNDLDNLLIIYNKFYNDTGYYHNDMWGKNVCKKDNKYYLIDFELINKKHKILDRKKRKRNEFYAKFY